MAPVPVQQAAVRSRIVYAQPTRMETKRTDRARIVPIAVPLLLKQQVEEPLWLLIVHVQWTPTETAAHAQLVTKVVIRTVPQMFKQLPAADVPRATTLRMARTGRHVQPVRSIRTKCLSGTEM